jgi:hypothetical protein
MDCHKLDLRMARLPGGEGASAGPSFEDHVSLLQERQALQEKCEEEKVALHTLEGLVTWCTLHLQNAESNPQLSVLLQETDKKRREISTMVRMISTVTQPKGLRVHNRRNRSAMLQGGCRGTSQKKMVLS